MGEKEMYKKSGLEDKVTTINTYSNQTEATTAYFIECNAHLRQFNPVFSITKEKLIGDDSLCKNKQWQENVNKEQLQKKFGKESPIFKYVRVNDCDFLGIPKHWGL